MGVLNNVEEVRRVLIFLITVLITFTLFQTADARSLYEYSGDADYIKIEKIPPDIKKMQDALARNPDDSELAVTFSKRCLEQARDESNPAYYNVAQSALKPWWNSPNPPVKVLVLRATIRQHFHDFAAAIKDLDTVLKIEPHNAQALVTKAVILQVRGNYEEAKRSCLPLLKLSTNLIAITCITGITSLMGQAEKSYALLDKTLDEAPETSSTPEKTWALTVLAEIAERTGKTELAEAHFKDARALSPYDIYLNGAYADFLLARNRPADVLQLLKNNLRSDAVLLRVVLAEKKLGRRELKNHVAILKRHFAYNHLSGDNAHGREEARFALHVLDDPATALKLAKANWDVQKEHTDAIILLEAALAAHNRYAAAPVLEWVEKNHGEDAEVAGLAQRIKAVTASP